MNCYCGFLQYAGRMFPSKACAVLCAHQQKQRHPSWVTGERVRLGCVFSHIACFLFGVPGNQKSQVTVGGSAKQTDRCRDPIAGCDTKQLCMPTTELFEEAVRSSDFPRLGCFKQKPNKLRSASLHSVAQLILWIFSMSRCQVKVSRSEPLISRPLMLDLAGFPMWVCFF